MEAVLNPRELEQWLPYGLLTILIQPVMSQASDSRALPGPFLRNSPLRSGKSGS